MANLWINDKIKKSKAYNGLTKMMQSIVIKRNNVQKIKNGLNIAKHKGIERLEKEHNFSWANLLIIKELSQNDN